MDFLELAAQTDWTPVLKRFRLVAFTIPKDSEVVGSRLVRSQVSVRGMNPATEVKFGTGQAQRIGSQDTKPVEAKTDVNPRRFRSRFTMLEIEIRLTDGQIQFLQNHWVMPIAEWCERTAPRPARLWWRN
ncbi:MAG: hypothetical protein HY706_11560 [Candidatus Hydrogenedentes bacterium]|nr:hypothetical protein [Candidatus Hydrogenedentota bacterium]